MQCGDYRALSPPRHASWARMSARGPRSSIGHPLDGVPVRVMKPDGVDEGIGEAGIAEELDKVVQFERYGFVRINCLGEPIVAYFAHR